MWKYGRTEFEPVHMWRFINGCKIWWLDPEPDEVEWKGSLPLECADGGGQANGEDEDSGEGVLQPRGQLVDRSDESVSPLTGIESVEHDDFLDRADVEHDRKKDGYYDD